MEKSVYIATEANGLQALALDDGAKIGDFETGRSWWTSPAIAGDTVYTIDVKGTVYA